MQLTRQKTELQLHMSLSNLEQITKNNTFPDDFRIGPVTQWPFALASPWPNEVLRYGGQK